MDIKKWQARKEDKEVVKEKQRKVQKELRQAFFPSALLVQSKIVTNILMNMP